MSEKQGGQHEVGIAPVQAAASFFTTLTIDGQNRDVVNIWRHVSVEGGDQLILRLDFEEYSSKHVNYFTLNHYYKQMQSRSMQMNEFAEGRFQLIPDVFQTAHHDDMKCCLRQASDLKNVRKGPLSATRLQAWLNTQMPGGRTEEYAQECRNTLGKALEMYRDYKVAGYWHIGQSYTKKSAYTGPMCPNDDRMMIEAMMATPRGQHGRRLATCGQCAGALR